MLPSQKSPPLLVGTSPALKALRLEIDRAARCDAKVLITGESGSGKEIVAQLIHSTSRRHLAPMMAINCAAVAESLLETELFGHTRGSFTGAYRDRAGIFESANGGSVLLDEIGETSPRMQGMLLRFLETGEVQRVGSEKPHTRVDVRIIASTHRVLSESVAANTFRDDLYYRLNIIDVHVPPLREHPGDIPELLDYWIDHFAASYRVPRPVLAAQAFEALCRYHWPGNVRELRNAVERVVSRGLAHEVTISDLAPEIAGLREVAKSSAQPAATQSRAELLYSEMVEHGQSFWTVVYGPFASHDLTRADLRAIVSRGLEQTFGSYRVLVELFNMQPNDYKRFLALLHKHHCHMPYQQFRTAAPIRMTPAQIKARRSGSPKILSA